MNKEIKNWTDIHKYKGGVKKWWFLVNILVYISENAQNIADIIGIKK